VFVETLDRPLFSPLVHGCQGCEQIRTIKMRKALGETPGPFPVLHPTTPTKLLGHTFELGGEPRLAVMAVVLLGSMAVGY